MVLNHLLNGMMLQANKEHASPEEKSSGRGAFWKNLSFFSFQLLPFRGVYIYIQIKKIYIYIFNILIYMNDIYIHTCIHTHIIIYIYSVLTAEITLTKAGGWSISPDGFFVDPQRTGHQVLQYFP